MMSSTCARSHADPHLLLGRVGLADPQILGDRAVEQQHLLEHHADIAPQAREREGADVHAVDLHHARLRIEDAVQQRQRRRLAGAGRADQRDGLARQRGEGEIGDRGPLAVIGERDVLELDQAAHAAGIDRVGAVAHRRHGVEHVEELLQPRRVHHHAIGEMHDLFELADQHGGKAHEHDDLADRGGALA